MASSDDSKVISFLLVFPIISTIILGILLTLYVFFNDYIAVELINVLETLFTDGLISSNFLNAGSSIQDILNVVPNMIDSLFLLSFITMVFESIYISYRAKRKGYFEIFTYLSYGVIIFLFLLSIFKIVSDYLYDLFFNIMLENLTVELSFFTYYIDNMFIISLSILLLNIAVNYLDLNFLKFQQKKQDELSSEEI